MDIKKPVNLIAFLNSDINERNNNLPEQYCLKSGYANGYVAVPPANKYRRWRNWRFHLPYRMHGGRTNA